MVHLCHHPSEMALGVSNTWNDLAAFCQRLIGTSTQLIGEMGVTQPINSNLGCLSSFLRDNGFCCTPGQDSSSVRSVPNSCCDKAHLEATPE